MKKLLLFSLLGFTAPVFAQSVPYKVNGMTIPTEILGPYSTYTPGAKMLGELPVRTAAGTAVVVGEHGIKSSVPWVLEAPIATSPVAARTALAKTAARLVPFVGVALTAYQVADILKPDGYEWCGSGWCAPKYPNMPTTTNNTWRSAANSKVYDDKALATYCEEKAQAQYSGTSWSNWTVSSFISYPNSTQAQCNAKLTAKSSGAVQNVSLEIFNKASSVIGCASVDGTIYAPQNGVCVSSDTTKTSVTPEQVETKLTQQLATAPAKAAPLLNAISEDMKNNKNAPANLWPQDPKGTLTLAWSDGSSPPVTISTKGHTLPDGTPVTTVTTGQVSVTPKIVGDNTVGGSTIEYVPKTTITETTTNNNTNTVVNTTTTQTNDSPAEAPKTEWPEMCGMPGAPKCGVDDSELRDKQYDGAKDDAMLKSIADQRTAQIESATTNISTGFWNWVFPVQSVPCQELNLGRVLTVDIIIPWCKLVGIIHMALSFLAYMYTVMYLFGLLTKKEATK